MYVPAILYMIFPFMWFVCNARTDGMHADHILRVIRASAGGMSGSLCMDDYGLTSSLIDLAALRGDAVPRMMLQDLEKGLLTDVWPGYLHLTCGAFTVPVDDGVQTSSGGGKHPVTLPEHAAIKKLHQSLHRAAEKFARSFSTQPLTVKVTNITEEYSQARHHQERGAFYVMKVTFDQPTMADEIRQLLQQVSNETGFPVTKGLFKVSAQVQIYKCLCATCFVTLKVPTPTSGCLAGTTAGCAASYV